MRGMRAAAKYRRSVKGYGILASPIAMGEVASAASRWGCSCRTRLCGWCSERVKEREFAPECCFNAARGFVSGAVNFLETTVLICSAVSMPHAALWVVQQPTCSIRSFTHPVSMPHAALWVVQPGAGHPTLAASRSFNAARGFVGGAANNTNGGF